MLQHPKNLPTFEDEINHIGGFQDGPSVILGQPIFPTRFSYIAGYPNHVPTFHVWNAYLPRFSGNKKRRPNQNLKDFYECLEQQGIYLEDV